MMKSMLRIKSITLFLLAAILLLPSGAGFTNRAWANQTDTINLVKNGSFEQAVVTEGLVPQWGAWLPAGNPVVSIVEEDAKQGQQALYISATQTGSVGVLNQSVAVGSQKSYVLGYWMKTEDIDAGGDPLGDAYVRIQFLNSQGTQTGSSLATGSADNSGKWRYYSTSFTTPAGTTMIKVEPMLYRASGHVWFDDVLLYDPVNNTADGFIHAEAELQASGTVRLAWMPLLSGSSGRQVTYYIYRSNESDFIEGDSLLVGTVQDQQFYDRSVKSGENYYYTVQFEADEGEWIMSDPIQVTVPAQLPAVQPVQSFKAIYTINQEIMLTWSLENDQRAASLRLYASDQPITELTIGDALEMVGAETPAPDRLEWIIPVSQFPQYNKPYYAAVVTDGDGHTSTVAASQVYSFLPLIDEAAPEAEHPYLMTTQHKINQVLANIPNYPWMQTMRNMIIANADIAKANYSGMTVPLPKNDGGHWQMTDAARLLAYAYIVTNDESYAAAAQHILLLYADYYAQHDFIFNQSKDDGYMLVPLAWGYDLVYNSSVWSEEQRARVEEGVFRTGAKRISQLPRGRLNNQGVTNWAVGVIGFLLRDQTLLNEAFDRDNYGLKYNIINGLLDDGYWWEQTMAYHEERTEYMIYLAEAAANSNYDLYGYMFNGERDMTYQGSDAPRMVEGRLTEAEDRSIKELLDFPFYFMFPDLSRPVFADSDYSYLTARNMYEMGYSHYEDEKYGWLLSRYLGHDRSNGGLEQYYSLFSAQPQLPDGASFTIGNGYFSKKGYNKLGSSIFLDSGAAILRSPGNYTESVNLAMQWSPFGSVGHSHADKLGIVLFGQGKQILVDPGRYTYGSAGHKEFAKHTLAHNTLVVDEKSQYPYTDSDDEWKADAPDRSSGGERNAVSIGPVARILQASNHNVYVDQGVDLTRTAVQIDDYVVDIFKAESTQAHRYDYPLTVNGLLEHSSTVLAASNPEVRLGSSMGYKHVKEISKGTTDEAWSTSWDLGENKGFRTTMLAGGETEVIKGSGISKSGNFTNEMLIARRDGQSHTLFYNVLEPYTKGSSERTITPLTVQQSDPNSPEAQAAQIVSADGVKDTIMAGMQRGEKQAGLLTSDGEISIHREISSYDEMLALVNGTHISGIDLSLQLSAASTIQLTRLADHALRIDFDGSEAAEVAISGLPQSYQVYQLALQDENELSEVVFTYSGTEQTISFTAEPEKIYIVATIQGAASLPAPTSIPMGGNEQQQQALLPGKVEVIQSPLAGTKIEAEDFVRETGGKVTVAFKEGSHTTNNPLGDAFYGWDNKGHQLEWEIDIPTSGKYRVMLRYATLVLNSVREFQMDDGPQWQFHFPLTPGWNDRRNGLLQKADGEDLLFELETGKHTIRMDNISGALNLDYFVLELVEADVSEGGNPNNNENGQNGEISSQTGNSNEKENDEQDNHNLDNNERTTIDADEVQLTDVEGHWASTAIQEAVRLGIIKGYPDQTFRPDVKVTRAEFTVMLARALKLEGQEVQLTFRDKQEISQWALSAVAGAVKAGIIHGYSDDTFRPKALISRAELAVMLARSNNLAAATHTVPLFKDVQHIPLWAREYVAAVYEAGMMVGRANQLFAPQEQASRAEAATVLVRMLKKT